MSRKVFCIILIIVVVSIMIGCSLTSNQSKMDSYNDSVITIATNNNQPKAILNVMQKLALLEKYLPEEIEVEWTNLSGFANNRDALVSGQVDIVSQPATGLIVAIESGYPLRIISNSMGSTSATVYSHNAKINTLDDLILAKKIAIQSSGNSYHIAFQKMCADKFGDAHIFDDNLIVMEYEDIITSFKVSNDIDAAIIAWPYSTRAEEIDNVTQLFELSDILTSYGLGNYMCTSEKFYDENQLIIDAFLKAEEDAIAYMNEQPKETAELLSDIYQLEADVISKELIKCPPHISILNYDETGRLLLELGVLEEKPLLFSDLPNYEKIPQ